MRRLIFCINCILIERTALLQSYFHKISVLPVFRSENFFETFENNEVEIDQIYNYIVLRLGFAYTISTASQIKPSIYNGLKDHYPCLSFFDI